MAKNGRLTKASSATAVVVWDRFLPVFIVHAVAIRDIFPDLLGEPIIAMAVKGLN